MLPTFLVIGAQKAGTSSLHAYLTRHPDVFMSATKELDFFVAERNWPRGRAWYEAHFAGADGVRAAGESSPLYSMYPSYPDVPTRIASMLPDVRLVYLVRDPFARMRSHYLHVVAEGTERRPLEAVARDDSGLIAFSLYAMQLERYLEQFADEQLLVLPTEWLRDDREATVRRVLDFVGADPGRLPPNLHDEAHRSVDKRIPWRGTRLVRRAARLLPGGWGERVDTITSRPISRADTAMSPMLERAITDQFRAQLPLVRHLVETGSPGRPFDGWGLG